MRYALINGLVYSNGEFSKTDVLIEGGRISRTGDFKRESKTYDFSGHVLLPGLLNAHAHFGETIFKGLFKFKDLDEYIHITEGINSQMSDLATEMRSASFDMTLLKFLPMGITTVCAGRCSEECDNANIRSFSGYMFMQTKKLEHFITDFQEQFKQYSERIEKSELSHPLIFLHSLSYCSPKVLELVSNLARKHQIKLTVHTAETENEKRHVFAEHGKTSVEVLDDYGLLNGNALLVHCCYVSDSDIELLREHKANVIVCPSSNIRLNNRLPPVDRFLENRINVSVATDGLATSKGNMFEECLILKRHLRSLDDTALVDMTTRNPSRALSLDAGTIDRNKLADIAIFKADPKILHRLESEPSIEALASLKASDVIVNGKFALRDGKSNKLDAKHIIREFKDVQNKIRLRCHL